MNGSTVPLGDFQRMIAAAGFQYRVIAVLQEIASQGTERLLVFHEQNGLGSAEDLNGVAARSNLQGGLIDARKINFKHRPLPWFTVGPDVAATLLHDAIDSRQAEACASAKLFGGEKRFEEVRLSLLVHPDAGV